jgi:predicted transcriptional regulator
MAKMNENSVKLLDFLKANTDKKMTVDQVAEGTGLSKPTITGAFTAFVKKGLGIREEDQIPGEVEVSLLVATDAAATCDSSEMSDNAKAILARVTAADYAPETLDDMAIALGIDKKKVNGSFNALVKKGLCARVAATAEASVTVKYLVLTDAGVAYDPAEDAE